MTSAFFHGFAGIGLVAATVWTPAAAQEAFDCVIEPSIVLKLGSAEEGIIEEVLVQRGDVVREGQVVARLEAEAERAALRSAEERASSNAAVEIAESRVALFSKDAERVEMLHSKNLVADSVLDNIRSSLEQAQLELRQAKEVKFVAGIDKTLAEARVRRRVILSPIDGLVVRRMIGPGEYVYSQAPIAEIAQVDPLHIEVFLPTALYPELTTGQSLTVRPAQPIGGSYEARIAVIDQVFDAASDTFGIRLTLANPDWTLPAGIDCEIDVK